jgi:hypothetical protein
LGEEFSGQSERARAAHALHPDEALAGCTVECFCLESLDEFGVALAAQIRLGILGFKEQPLG